MPWLTSRLLPLIIFAHIPIFAQELQLCPLFGDNAVLQSAMPVPVWGKAKPGSTVRLLFSGQNLSAKADEKGAWSLNLEALKESSSPQDMTVSAGSDKITSKNILVGDVWFVCGRSNISFSVSRMADSEKERQNAAQPLLRLFKVTTKDPSQTPLDKMESKGWKESSASSIPDFSAVGWVFGSELQKARKTPVGIVMSSWGGSPANMWIEKSFFDSRKKGGSAASKGQKDFEKESQNFHKTEDGQSSDKIANKIGACFNSHVNPLIPMAMKGTVIFFDGAQADEIAMLAENWRGLWKQGDFPFIFIQVHRQGGPVEVEPNAKGDSNRASYLPLLGKIPNSAMVVALDTGVSGDVDIHPPNKRPVGERCALAARSLAYGEKIVSSGPTFKSMKTGGGNAVISFDNVGSGLEAKDGPLEGFAVSSDGKKWIWGEAKIEGDTVVVSAPSLDSIKAVRYAYAPKNPKGNLYNKEGLPASPFSAGDKQ